jgi:hypothetical protein
LNNIMQSEGLHERGVIIKDCLVSRGHELAAARALRWHHLTSGSFYRW